MESDKDGAPGELEVRPYKQEETSRADADESPLLQVMSSNVTRGVPELLDPVHPRKKASAHEVSNIQQHTPAEQSEVLQPKDIITPEQGGDISNSSAKTIPPKKGDILNFSEKNILPKKDGTPNSSAKNILFKQADTPNFPAKTILPKQGSTPKTILPKESDILNFSEKAIPPKQRDIPKAPAKTTLPKQDTTSYSPAKTIPAKQGDTPSSSTNPVLPKLGNILKVSAKTILPKRNIPKSSEEPMQPKEGGTPKSSEETIQPIEGNIPKLAEEAMELLDVDMVKVILSKEGFELALKEAGEKLVAVDVSATWCVPCRTIKPLFRSLSVKHEDVVFLEVDVDDCEELVKDLEIICIPTIQFYKKEEKVGEICGTLKEKLEAIIAELK